MKSTDIGREAHNRRRDIGSGEYWELLDSDLLEVFLRDKVLRKKLLASFSDSDLITWNEKYGIATIGTSRRFSVLVAKPPSIIKLKNYIKNRGGITGIKQISLTPKGREALHSETIELFSKYVKLGRVKDYRAGAWANNVAKFIEDHFTLPGERTPRYRLITEHTVDTGKSVGLLLRSSAQPVQTDVKNPTSKAYERHGTVKRKSQVSGSRFSKTKMLLEALNDDNQKDLYVVDPYNEETNNADEFINVASDGRLDLYNTSNKPVSPALSVGGTQSNIRTPTIKQHQWGTRNHSYLSEGTVDHPLGSQTASFFTPTPAVVSSLYAPLAFIADNPSFLIGIVALLSSEKNQYKYTVIRNDLTTKIIDNKDIEDQLLGDN